jgi:shikimate kinase
MGVGKTTTARALATRLGWPLSDSDDEIEQLTGRSGAEIAAELGVDAQHQLERGVLIAALARPTPLLITAAASVIESDVVRNLLLPPTVVVLEAPAELVLRRQAKGDHRRPMSIQELESLARRRAPLLDQVADLTLDNTKPTDLVVADIMSALGVQGSTPPT